MQDRNWLEAWQKDGRHREKKAENFALLDSFLGVSPKQILEIGCGLAIESELFQQKYGSDLFLIDGDFESNTATQTRDINYGDAADMKFYSKIADLKRSFESRNMRYRFFDANDLQLPEDLRFDLIYSFASCGFHYPVSTYADLIRKHSTESTTLILELRTDTVISGTQTGIKVKDVLAERKKSIIANCEII